MKRRRRFALALIVVGLAALSIPTAFGYFSDSATINYSITAADKFDGGERFVWVCKVIGEEGNYRLSPGKNPIKVSVDALDEDGEFPDAQPSYLVGEGETCTWPRDGAETSATRRPEPTPTTVPAVSASTSSSTTTTIVREPATSSSTTTPSTTSTRSSTSTTTSTSTTSTTTTSSTTTTLPPDTTSTTEPVDSAEGDN